MSNVTNEYRRGLRVLETRKQTIADMLHDRYIRVGKDTLSVEAGKLRHNPTFDEIWALESALVAIEREITRMQKSIARRENV